MAVAIAPEPPASVKTRSLSPSCSRSAISTALSVRPLTPPASVTIVPIVPSMLWSTRSEKLVPSVTTMSGYPSLSSRPTAIDVKLAAVVAIGVPERDPEPSFESSSN